MVTMRHYLEVDIGLSESAEKLTLGDLELLAVVHFKVMKVEMAHIV